MPAPIAPLIGLAIGIAFAWAASEELARAPGSGVTSRALLVVTLFSLLVFAPISAYFLAFAPDWSLAYLIDPRRLPSAIDLALVLIDAASVPAGFALAARRARSRSFPALIRLLSIPAVLCLVFIAASFQRLSVDATYTQYHGDFGTLPLAGSPLGYGILWMFTILAGAVAWTARSLHSLSGKT